ncbi:MAG: glycerol-3-phosphate dehydrogenase subunit GlpB [Bifidobacteriaceae bacterium]|jgi:glycerol-3-phosphate dehydrogenase subunit B|nr:glycerol-3-phosphate dehydrogenase subunit GlpB [Bifidobacteriaceae bacterium]
MSEVVVIGAGLGGLMAACELAGAGLPVRLISQGEGSLSLSNGTVDLLGYAPDLVWDPLSRINQIAPPHPYQVIGSDNVRRAVAALTSHLPDGYLVGQASQNQLVPTALGAWRPTALLPASLAPPQPKDQSRWLIVGFDRVKDFYPKLVAANLSRTKIPGGGRVTAIPVRIDLPDNPGLPGGDVSAMTVARAFDQPDFAAAVGRQLAQAAGQAEADAIGVPAVLGTAGHDAWRQVSQAAGRPVFEIGLVPPSPPGFRLNQLLLARARQLGVRLATGARVTGFQANQGRIVQLTTDAAGHGQTYEPTAVVYFPGGFESGAIAMDSTYNLAETLFDLPLAGLAPVSQLISPSYSPNQTIFQVGVQTDKAMRPLTDGGEPVYTNLYAGGGLLAGAIRWTEQSGEGIVLGSAMAAVRGLLDGIGQDLEPKLAAAHGRRTQLSSSHPGQTPNWTDGAP